ncbi:hypothetical protein Thermo_02067 [Thermoplasmatales archaeon]|nr:hypothetical protein Thermo_02067 [Thermoplasmatales archaeon]
MRALADRIIFPLLSATIVMEFYFFAELFSAIYQWPFSYSSFSLLDLYYNLGIVALVIFGLIVAYRARKRVEMANTR